MNDRDIDRLLEQSFRGEPANRLFRARALQDSMAAFVLARRRHARRRLAALSAAAGFIAAVSFLLGRCSVSPGSPEATAPAVVATTGETVAVPNDLVAWLDAARLFRQLGMEDRMARAVDHAHRLLPYDRAAGAQVVASSADHGGEIRRQEQPAVDATPTNSTILSLLGVSGLPPKACQPWLETANQTVTLPVGD